MLGLYERRSFPPQESVWVGKYKNLINILHWHPECELIRVIHGNADIKIGDAVYACGSGDCLFCGEEELHYIHSKGASEIDVMIFRQSIGSTITGQYSLTTPLISYPEIAENGFRQIRSIIAEKPLFYKESLEVCAKGILIDLFNREAVTPRQSRKSAAKKLTDHIHENFASITFDEMVSYSGYSAAHFSKVFKQIAGMPFTVYLNFIKTERAISMIHSDPVLTMTEISSLCGFSTIRTFNRVFKSITGFAPSSLPRGFTVDRSVSMRAEDAFDPTKKASILL